MPENQINKEPTTKNTKEEINKENSIAESHILKHQTVIARNKENGRYYPGIVKYCPTPRYAYIIFTGSDTETEVPTRFMIPITGAVAVPTLHRGDYVLDRVLVPEKDTPDSETECFVPGIVQVTPCLEHPEFYTVLLYNKQKVTTMRKNLVKITADRYHFTVNFRIRMQKENESSYRPVDPIPPISEESTEVTEHETFRGKSTKEEFTDNKFQEEAPKSKSLPDISENEDVLARWPDGGWYYQGVILQKVGNNLYIVGDSTGDAEEIPRHDIITDKDDTEKKIEEGDYVVAAYPGYPSSYAPGQVVSSSDNSFDVTFYDKNEANLTRTDVYKLSQKKYNYDVEEILQYEQLWVGHPAIVRNDDTGEYEIATVKEKTKTGQEYMIVWNNGNVKSQDPRHMFGSFTRRPPLAKNEYVLAIASDDSDSIIYLPGEVTGINKQTKTFDVHFCNGKIKKSLPLVESQYYWLSENYYKKAKAYFLSKQ